MERGMGRGRFRLRVAFPKEGRLAHLSHLETARACERSVRRAGLPYAVSHGFNPSMRIAFGPALPVGTGGLREYYDVELDGYVRSGEALERLSEAAPQGLVPRDAAYVSADAPSLAAALVIAHYEVAVETSAEADEVQDALEEVAGDRELVVERKGRTKVFDLAECLPKRTRVRSIEGGALVEITTRMGPAGSLRPESLVDAALGPLDTPYRVASVTRTDLLAEEGSDWLSPLG
jgi:radical SAM-linked protein